MQVALAASALHLIISATCRDETAGSNKLPLLAFEVRVPHPFSEPFEPIAPASQPSWRQNKFDLRMKTLSTMRTCLVRLLSWARAEKEQFRARVMYWDFFDASFIRTKSKSASQTSAPPCVPCFREKTILAQRTQRMGSFWLADWTMQLVPWIWIE